MENSKGYFQKNKNKVIGVAIISVVVAFIVFVSVHYNPDRVLIRKSEDAVREQLLYNPDEATFSEQEVYEDDDDGLKNVSGLVLASNGFNAKSKVEYIVTFDEHGEVDATYIYDEDVE